MTEATPRRLLAAAAMAIAFALALTGSASARPLIGSDGKIHACYRVKGKPRGQLRAVKSARARCRRGERKIAWVASGAIGQAGAPGAAGTTGHQGAPGSSESSSAALLEAEVLALADRVKDLEAILQGVTNSQLLAAIDAVPLVATLCGEVTGLVAQTNLLRGSVNSLVSTLSGSLLGAIFGGVAVPPALPETLSCPGA